MKKIACVALLMAASLQAQNPPAPKETPLPTREEAPQDQVPPIVRDRQLREETTKKLLDLGYTFDFGQPKSAAPTPCAIPLMPILVPNTGNFAISNSPANPSIDPKIVSAPPLPACPPKVVVPLVEIPLVVKPVQREAEKK